MRKYGFIGPRKAKRKIMRLRSMNIPNHEDGATKYSWRTFWEVLHKLKLTQKLHYNF